MKLPDGREVPDIGCFGMLVLLFMFYWMISCSVWAWRNPTANPMTGFSYFSHVINWEKMDQFQVPDSR